LAFIAKSLYLGLHRRKCIALGKLTRATRETYNPTVPLYEYQCPKCGCRFERIQKFSDPDPKKCPNCGAGKVDRLLHPPAVQFKGTGWYVTDYARRGSGSAEASKKEGHAAESSATPAKEKTESTPKSEHKKK
jgi:putative FmdB family regulatory protein